MMWRLTCSNRSCSLRIAWFKDQGFAELVAFAHEQRYCDRTGDSHIVTVEEDKLPTGCKATGQGGKGAPELGATP